jgi:electron transfer flavoprotein beta subunit
MKALVAVKRVIDYNVTIRVKADQTGVETANIKMSMNPFDEIALEEAVRLKEAGVVSEVVAVTVGEAVCQDVLRSALAVGADRAVLIEVAGVPEPANVARCLEAIVKQEGAPLVFLGKQAIDDDANQVGQMLAARLGIGQITNACEVQVKGSEVTVTREIDGGLETLKSSLPIVITADLRLNAPRFATLPNIMKAKKKPIETQTLEALGVTLKAHTEVLAVFEPPVRAPGILVNSVTELVDKLRHDKKVIA